MTGSRATTNYRRYSNGRLRVMPAPGRPIGAPKDDARHYYAGRPTLLIRADGKRLS